MHDILIEDNFLVNAQDLPLSYILSRKNPINFFSQTGGNILIIKFPAYDISTPNCSRSDTKHKLSLDFNLIVPRNLRCNS